MTADLDEALLERARRVIDKMDATLEAAAPAPAVTRILGAGSFTERFGSVQYRRVMAKPLHWRRDCLDSSVCAFQFEGCTGSSTVLVFDHCHRHGWVRGILCNGCNVRLGYLEAAMSIKGVTVDLGSTAYARFLANCPGCTGDLMDVFRRLPAKGPFADPVKPPRAVREPPDKRTGPGDTTPQGRINIEASTTTDTAKLARATGGGGDR